MNRRSFFPGVRLVCVGYATLLLLIGLTFGGLMPPPAGAVLGIGGIVVCVAMLVVLTPVAVWGSWKDRFLALLLAFFPALWLAFTVFGLGMRS
jgi:hypothetical protein